MGDNTAIEWTDATWNPVRGCALVSRGCTNCYAMKVAHRFAGTGGPYDGLTKATVHGPVWTGEVTTHRELLELPLRWKRPRRIFVNSMSDLFHPGVPASFVLEVFAVMEAAEQHTFQILTKRPERMLEVLGGTSGAGLSAPPLRNVWLGVSVEDQAAADERVPLLLQAPAAVRWISAEPLLGPVDVGRYLDGHEEAGTPFDGARTVGGCKWYTPALDWVVAGGESGPGARPMHPAWARQLRDQCVAAGVPFLFKQWGDWAVDDVRGHAPDRVHWWTDGPTHYSMLRVGKRAAGRELDGRTWDEYPAT